MLSGIFIGNLFYHGMNERVFRDSFVGVPAASLC